MRMFKNFVQNIQDFLRGETRDDVPPEAFRVNEIKPEFDRFSDYLNYAAYFEQEQVFVLENTRSPRSVIGLGFCLEINPLIGANDETMAQFRSVYEAMPEKTGLQISLFGSPDIRDYLTRYENAQSRRMDGSRSLFAELAIRRTDYWKKASREQLFLGNPLRFREMRCVLSFVLPADEIKERDLDAILEIRSEMISILKSMNMFSHVWTGTELIRHTRKLLNPHLMFQLENNMIEGEYDELRPLHHQIIASNTLMRVMDSGEELVFGSKKHNTKIAVRSFSIGDYPNNFHLGEFTNLLGSPVYSSINYPCPFLITICARRTEYDKEKAIAQLKFSRAAQVAGTKIGSMSPEFAKRAADWSVAQESFEDGAGGLMHMHMQLTLFDTVDNLDNSTAMAHKIWKSKGFELYADDYLQAQDLQLTLPMAMDSDMMGDLDRFKRWHTKTMTNLLSLSPVVGDWSGVGEPVIGLVSRRGQVMGFDLFANNSGNYNAAIVGASGSGKSFFVNQIASGYCANGAKVWIIDVGRSYEKLCHTIGGQYIEFGVNSNLVINPFDTVNNIDEDIEILKLLLSLMIAPNEGLSDYQLPILSKVIREVWDASAKDATIDDVAERLVAYSDINGLKNEEINRLGEQLHPFTTDGEYGRYFNGKSTLTFDKDFVVLELEELKSKPTLQQVVMRFLIYKITNSMYLTRNQKKIAIVDEAWSLFSGGGASSAFIEEGYRRARKYEGAMISATQGIDDYYANPAATAALVNSDWLFILRSKETSVLALEKRQPIQITDHILRMIRSLQTVSGQYSDVFVSCPLGYGIGSLYSDPFNVLLSSSKAEDFEAVNNKVRLQGLSVPQAIEATLVERGIV